MDTDVEKANSAVTSDRAGIPVLTRLYRELKERLATSDRAPDPVDVLIIGGGIQGLVLLETLTKRGYSTGMVTNGPLGHGQSLHAHGFLESGYTMPDPELRASVVEDWLPYLDENDISVYGEWFFIAPDGPVSALQPKWDAGGYPYETVSVDDLPTEYHVSDLFADGTDTNVVAIHEYCFPKRQLVQRLAEGHEDRILSGDITDFGVEQSGDAYVLEWVDVHDHTTGERVRLTPSHVIVAAGGGTPKVVGEIADAVGEAGGDGATVRASVDQVTFDRVHMLTLRGPPEALPDVSAVIPPKKLKIVSHRSVGPGEKDLVTWYVTKKPLSPIPPEDATAEALVSVDPEHTAASFNTLFAAVPGIRESVVDGTIECYVYAGCKQGTSGELNAPHCEPVNGVTNATIALPSVAGAVWLTARRAVELVEETVKPSNSTAVIPGAGNVTIGNVTEHGSDVVWLSWPELLAAYPGIGEPTGWPTREGTPI